eukprot:3305802-Rhodomonas_salina.1
MRPRPQTPNRKSPRPKTLTLTLTQRSRKLSNLGLKGLVVNEPVHRHQRLAVRPCSAPRTTLSSAFETGRGASKVAACVGSRRLGGEEG